MKKFLIIGNSNAITYKEVFPFIKDNKIWLGEGKNLNFILLDGTIKGATSRWFTNLEYNERHKPLVLTERYSPDKYPKYDNYDAIEVSRTKDIPMNYNGVMGVPIMFMDRYCPEQFGIVGVSNLYDRNSALTKVYTSEECRDAYFKLFGKEGIYPLNSAPIIIKDGVLKQIYKRILIRRKV